MRTWGVGVAGGYAALGAIAKLALHVPRSELLFGLCALLTLALALITAPLLKPRGGDDDEGGIGLPSQPDEPPPPWWPEFEREFREYAERLTSVRG
jgi:hypothetical protein